MTDPAKTDPAMTEPAATESGAESAADRERFEDAMHVLHGEGGSGTVRRLLYTLYLTAIFGAVYGFNLLRATLVTSDPAWVDAVGSGWGLLVLLILIGLLLLTALKVARVRGPVVPQLPFLDHIASSGLDRAVVLREYAQALLIGALGVGALLGSLAGGAVVGSGRGGVITVVVAVVLGALIGLTTAAAALVGQRQASGSGLERSVAGLLRGLRLLDLRTQAIRTTHVGGAVLAGDLRAARLETAAPVTRGRGVRLRSRGPRRTVIARDLLGMRRAPGRAAAGALGLLAAYALVAVGVGQPAAPRIVAILAMAVAYFAFGALAEGLRLVADNAGTAPLIGLTFRAEAVAHLALPCAAALIVGAPAAATVAAASGASIPLTLAFAAAMTVVLAGAALMAAFRGSPPDLSFIGEIGPMAMAYWYARPITIAALTGGLLLAAAADLPALAPVLWVTAAGMGAGYLWYGLHLARRLELGHRL